MHSARHRRLAALFILPLAAHGTIVTTATDEDDATLGGGSGISLREAVKYSSAGTTITFAPALSGLTIRLTLGELVITSALTIDGSSLPQRITLSADRTGNGKTADDTYVIQLNSGNLVLDSLILADANLGESRGCITTPRTGSFSLKLDHCTLARNSGYHAGAIYWSLGNLTISNSTFSENSAVKGGSSLSGGSAVLSIGNCTFSKNKGISIAYSGGTLSMNHTTIAENTTTSAAPAVDIRTVVAVSITNSIITGNIGPSYPSISGSFNGTNNLLAGNPLLAPLGDYGGPTHTMPPLPGSPAIDMGGTSTLTTDQRGLTRSGTPDIGAAEYQGNADLTRFWKLDFDGDGSPYGTEQALGTDSAVADSANSRHLTAPAFNASGHAVLCFGIAPAAPGTRWIVRRSIDLLTFSEIYRYDGTTDTAAPDITFLRTATRVTITDTNPPPGGGFYRFEARLEP